MKKEGLATETPWWQSPKPVKVPPDLLWAILGDIFEDKSDEPTSEPKETIDTPIPSVDNNSQG